MRYSDYFHVNPNFKSVIDASVINNPEHPDEWLRYYPHEKFQAILRKILEKMEKGDKSVWIYGPYGTGKSHTALVLRKLFLESEQERVEKYLEERKNVIPETLRNTLMSWRTKKILPVFTSGAEGLNKPADLLVRMQIAITTACKECGYDVPVMGNAAELLNAICEYNESEFWKKRDELQGELLYLTPDYTTIAQLKSAIEADEDHGKNILKDIRTIHESRSVYLNLTLDKFLDWCDSIRKANKISKILFLWDEFTSYIDENRAQLVTFRGLAEAQALGKGLLFVPITHMRLSAFVAENSQDNANKAKNGYEFCELLISENIVFKLANDALRINEGRESEWHKECAHLRSTIKPIVENYILTTSNIKNVSLPDFEGILPFHPMAAILLKAFSEKVGANTRSFFEYIHSTDGESEFKKFIADGGPTVQGHQFLTVDYLWHYLVEHDDIGKSSDISEVGNEYALKKDMLDTREQRVFKAICLYNIMQRALGKDANELLMPTEETIVRAFEGDGDIVNVKEIISSLANVKHCCSVFGGRVELFRTGQAVDPTPFLSEFKKHIAEPIAESITKEKFSGNLPSTFRYDVRGFNGAEIKQSDINKRDKYGDKGDGNNVLLAFLFAKDEQDLLQVPEKAKQMAKQFSGMRMVFVSPSGLSFCGENKNHWKEFCEQLARANAATDNASKATFQKEYEKIRDQWKRQVINANQTLAVTIASAQQGEEPHVLSIQWNQLQSTLDNCLDTWFPCGCDKFSGNNGNAFRVNALRGWATAGMTGLPGAQFTGLVNNYKAQQITWDTDWFEKNPNHALTKIREFVENKRRNAVNGSGSFSLRKTYIELQRAPYGLQYVAYSAFVLGFVTREWLNMGLQWEDGTSSGELNAEILAEIIEKVVSDNGDNKIKNEKKICKLSKEEKKFQSGMNELFALSTPKDATMSQTITDILARVGRISKIPFGILADHVRKHELTLGNEMAEVVEKLVAALQNSSKNDSVRKESIKAIGEILLKHEELIGGLKPYLTADALQKALLEFIKSERPDLEELAKEVDDPGFGYCEAVKNRLPDAAGGLWKPDDVKIILDEVYAQYQIQHGVQIIFGMTTFISYDKAVEKLRHNVFVGNHVSLAYLSETMPFVSELGGLLKGTGSATDFAALAQILAQNGEMIRELFINPAHPLQCEAVRKIAKSANLEINDDDVKAFLEGISNGAEMSAAEFCDEVVSVIKKAQAKSAETKVLTEWKEKKGSVSPKEWVLNNSDADAKQLLLKIIDRHPDVVIKLAQEVLNDYND